VWKTQHNDANSNKMQVPSHIDIPTYTHQSFTLLSEALLHPPPSFISPPAILSTITTTISGIFFAYYYIS
jgi:hypothetical protein